MYYMKNDNSDNNKKRVMYISQSNGGVARYLQNLLKYMDKDKYENILVYPSEYSDEKSEFENLFDKIEFIPMGREIGFNDIKSMIGLRKLIHKYNPDLIYAQSSKAGALARITNIIYRKPLMYNPHGWAFNMKVSNKKRLLYRLIEKILSSDLICSKIICISNKEKEYALQNGIGNEYKVQVIENGIDIEEYDKRKNAISCEQNNNFREKYNIPTNYKIVGMVGRISKQKAPDIFVEAANKIKRKFPNTFFVIVGDGEDRIEIEKTIEQYGLKDSFLITGWTDTVYDYIENFDYAMLLSRWEGFGLVLAEYMICGVPIIATNIDAIPQVITNNKTGILVEMDNVNEVVQAFENIECNENFAESLRKNGIDKVRRFFDVKRVAKQHEEIIDELLQNSYSNEDEMLRHSVK